jgi:putative hydrolase of the HAD superfamily
MALGGVRRAVLLDALGTLVALEPPGPRLAARLKADHGIELSAEEAERGFRAEIAHYRAHHMEGSDPDMLDALRGDCAEVLRAALPARVGDALARGELQQAMMGALRFSAYSEARATLEELRARGYALVVVSNWDVSLPAVLDEAGVGEALDGVLTSASLASAKPDPKIFRAALALAGVAAERAVHVGDSLEHDVAGALAAGVRAVWVRREGTAEAPKGVPTISSLAELLAVLRENLG